MQEPKRSKRRPRRMPRPERQGNGVALNAYVNQADGRACKAAKANTDLQKLNRQISDALDENNRVVIVDGDGNEKTVFPIDAREQIIAGRATLKGIE